jgi:hypothetical protein
MNKKLFLAGIISTVLVFGMVVVGCDNGSTSKENTDPKKIAITGLTGKAGYIMVALSSTADDSGDIEIGGVGTISSDSITLELLNGQSAWTGTGSYYLMIMLGDDNSEMYLYTDGKTLQELGITGANDVGKLPKITISDTTTTIPFTKFQLLPNLLSSLN